MPALTFRTEQIVLLLRMLKLSPPKWVKTNQPTNQTNKQTPAFPFNQQLSWLIFQDFDVEDSCSVFVNIFIYNFMVNGSEWKRLPVFL
jgi:hypothetical protein